jgi:6-phosphogluconolactonase (cycloisomerase 2 family)
VDPVAEATSTDFQHLYVANQGDSTIVEFNISGTGVLTSANTTTLSAEGNTPVALSMSGDGKFLYVANKYQPGCSSASETPCGGALAVFPVGTDGSLGASIAQGSLNYVPVGVNPTAVNALASGIAAYVTSYDSTKGNGYIYGYAASSGTLTALAGSPFAAGVKPDSLASDPTSRFVYVTDFAQNQLIAYAIIDQGVLHPLINGPFKTGNQPTGIQIDPRGLYIYLANELDNSLSAYAIDKATGTPSAAVNTSGTSVNSTGTQPVAVIIDPGFGRYVYTANNLDNSLSGFKINPNTGTLSITQNGPYPSIGLPTALASVPRGNHSIQVNQP